MLFALLHGWDSVGRLCHPEISRISKHKKTDLNSGENGWHLGIIHARLCVVIPAAFLWQGRLLSVFPLDMLCSADAMENECGSKDSKESFCRKKQKGTQSQGL